jgi:hypothetical protein
MNDLLIAEEFRAFCLADGALSAAFPHLILAQDKATHLIPSISFEPSFEAWMCGFRKGTLTLTVRSAPGDEGQGAAPNTHEDRFNLLYTKFCGAPDSDRTVAKANAASAKAAVIAFLNTRGHVELKDYGPALQAVSGDVDSGHLRTALSLRVAFRFTVPAPIALPTLDPDGGDFGAVDIAFACATAGTTVHYTLDGTDPTLASPDGTAGLHLPEPEEHTETLVKARAFLDLDHTQSSAVASATFRQDPN